MDILINHLSEGKYDPTWFEAAVTFMNKWRHILPLNMVHANVHQQKKLEKRGLNFMVMVAREYKIPMKYIWNTLFESKIYRLYGVYFYLRLLKRMVKLTIKKKH
jgi:hypothetical protein